MTKKKKSGKKRIPRPLYYPQLVVGTYTFDPLIKALDDIIETGEIETDEVGNYVYRNTLGVQKTIASSLLLFMHYLGFYAQRRQIELDVTPLENMLPVFQQKEDAFTESALNAAKSCLAMTKQVLSTIPPSEHREIIKLIFENYERVNGKGSLPKTGQVLTNA